MTFAMFSWIPVITRIQANIAKVLIWHCDFDPKMHQKSLFRVRRNGSITSPAWASFRRTLNNDFWLILDQNPNDKSWLLLCFLGFQYDRGWKHPQPKTVFFRVRDSHLQLLCFVMISYVLYFWLEWKSFFDSVKVLENHVTSSSWCVLRGAKLKTHGRRYLLGTYSSGNVVPVIW